MNANKLRQGSAGPIAQENAVRGLVDFGNRVQAQREEIESVARHNAYGWIKPNAEACHLCGRKEYATPVDGFQVNACDDCEQPVCEKCAEVDYDGNSEGYRNTQWVCSGGCKPEMLGNPLYCAWCKGEMIPAMTEEKRDGEYEAMKSQGEIVVIRDESVCRRCFEQRDGE